ncbi:MAG: folylpolyglutamate synthase/dihydrofolate synthase family protein [Acidobacteriota bacterium]
MNFKEALSYLEQVREKGTKLALDNIQKIIDNLPVSLDNIHFIQVAGTNGKGSTSHYLTSILKESGYRTGMFTSPHLQDLRERITINKKWISEKDFAGSILKVKEVSEELLRKKIINETPTYFEHMLLTSLFYFHKNNVDFAVMEVGLGGRLDATSTLSPVITIITNISYDHTKTLGKSLASIAAEKAGIIKNGVPVICGCRTNTAANRTVKNIAKEKSAPFFNTFDKKNTVSFVQKNDYYDSTYLSDSGKYRFRVFMNGNHQVSNAATSIKTIEVLNTRGFDIPSTAILSGIERNSVPGRIETFNIRDGIILDGGHNEESIKALSEYLNEKKKRDLTLIFGVLRDKKYRRMIKHLEPYVKNIIITEPVSPRALPAETLQKEFKEKKTLIKKNLGSALEEAFRFKNEILITGSLYLAGEMRNLVTGGINDRP